MISARSQAPTSLHRAARGSLLNLTGSAVGALATFAMAVVITRLSTSVEAGVFFSATSVFLIATSVGRLGTNTGLVYAISGARGRGEAGQASGYMRMAAVPVGWVALAIATALIAFADQLGQWLGQEAPEVFATYVRGSALFIPFAAIANLAAAGAQGLGSMKVYAVLDQMMRPVIQVAVVAGVLVLGGGASDVAFAWAGVYLPVAVLGWVWWRSLRARLDGPAAGTTTLSSKGFWKFTAPRALASVSQIVMQRLDIVLVGALASLTAAAVYAATTRFLVLGQMAGRAISLSIQPLLGAALARADRTEARDLYQVCTAWLIAGMWPLYLLLLGYAPVVLEIFGGGYTKGAPALVLLCAVMLFATACGTVDMVLNMAGKSLWNLANVLVALAVFIGLDFWLIPKWGFMGAAVGWGGAIAVANLLPLVQVLHTPGLHPFGRAALLTMTASLVCFGLLPLLTERVLGDGAGAMGAAIGAGLAAYTVFLICARRVLRLEMLARALRRKRVGQGPG